MTKISHLDSLWKWDWGELRNGLLALKAYCRRPHHQFACHWKRIASIVFWLVLKRMLLNSSNTLWVFSSYCKFWIDVYEKPSYKCSEMMGCSAVISLQILLSFTLLFSQFWLVNLPANNCMQIIVWACTFVKNIPQLQIILWACALASTL